MDAKAGRTASLSTEEFRRLMKRAKTASTIEQQLSRDRMFALRVPVELGLKLNNACNLRCSHCYEWNETGFHHAFERQDKNAELGLDTVRELLEFTRDSSANLYIWGGEPLIYSRFSELMSLLDPFDRWTTICTNGLLIEKRLGSLLPYSRNLALLISVEGLRDANDAIRGNGTFNKVVTSVRKLVQLREAGEYQGAIAVSLTINAGAVRGLTDFVRYFERLGVDSVYLAFPWFIPPAVGREMDAFSTSMMPNHLPIAGTASWHSFTFHLPEDLIPNLLHQMDEIQSQQWSCHVRFQPHLRPEEVTAFIRGAKAPAEGKTTCHAIRRRMDVLPSGDVVSCKFFPESKVGNLTKMTPSAIWSGSDYGKVRACIADGLSPICSKCGLLYTFG